MREDLWLADKWSRLLLVFGFLLLLLGRTGSSREPLVLHF